MIRTVTTLLVFVIFWSCSEKKAPNKFVDAYLLHIADFQDHRQKDSLLQFLRSGNPVYREAAAIAFASVQDTGAAPQLGNLLLEDERPEVRKAAAFALGQTGGIAAVNALIPAIHDVDTMVVREALEALGKTIGKNDLDVLRNYASTDSAGLEGLSWAFYRLALRNLADSTVVKKAAEFLNPLHRTGIRLAAAHFFGRTKLPLRSVEKTLISSSIHDPAPEVRMAVVGGLKRIDVVSASDVLMKILRSDKDDRVRNSAVRACINFSIRDSEKVLYGALSDSSLGVQISASELILKAGRENPVKRLEQEARVNRNMRVRANLYGALLSLSADDKALKEVMSLYGQSGDYAKSWLLTALGSAQGVNESDAFDFLSLSLAQSKVPILRTNAALAMVAMNYHPEFFKKNKARFVAAYRQGIAGVDLAVTGILAGAIGDSTLGYKVLIKDLTFLYDAKKKYKMPRDIESVQPLIEAIAYLEGKPKPGPLKNNFNHPIDWKLVKGTPDNQRILLKTTRGEVILRLFVNEAPGSVANFVGLVNEKYFDGKFFHRVVPNFVIQTGCNRGDGFGSEDYSLRSEFSMRRYKEGSVGMASAGKDTEGTQWFITHSPTPHLDGKYTIFAEVEKGQENADLIEVGDTIVSARLLQN